jgi:hypothetical protein
MTWDTLPEADRAMVVAFLKENAGAVRGVFMGMFKGVSREVLRAWQDNWIGETFARWLSAGSRRSA